MFEYSDAESTPPPDGVIQDAGVPVEFSYKGKVFRIYSFLTRWKETSPWWKHLGRSQEGPRIEEKTIWSVEAAPIGTMTTFEIEFNQTQNTWQVRPSSRGK